LNLRPPFDGGRKPKSMTGRLERENYTDFFRAGRICPSGMLTASAQMNPLSRGSAIVLLLSCSAVAGLRSRRNAGQSHWPPVFGSHLRAEARRDWMILETLPANRMAARKCRYNDSVSKLFDNFVATRTLGTRVPQVSAPESRRQTRNKLTLAPLTPYSHPPGSTSTLSKSAAPSGVGVPLVGWKKLRLWAANARSSCFLTDCLTTSPRPCIRFHRRPEWRFFQTLETGGIEIGGSIHPLAGGLVGS